MSTLMLEGVLAALLLAVIVYCWKLSKRLNEVQASREDLNQFLEDFTVSIERGEHAVAELKKMQEIVGPQLANQLREVSGLAQDLDFLTDRAEQVAQDLEDYISGTRALRKRASSNQWQQMPQKRLTEAHNRPPARPRRGGDTPSKKQAVHSLMDQIARLKSESEKGIPVTDAPRSVGGSR